MTDLSEISRLTQMKSKVNRLRRSPKAAPLNGCKTQQVSEFKTPTRPARVPFRRLVPDDSPSNDPEFHQDIIWDTTSPSPVRHGRGHRRVNVRAVDISDIANRIAPKNERLEEADSSLLQWIGDSAIPCTPELQKPKHKPGPTKLCAVEDLMRLAKQFDFNMRQDGSRAEHWDEPCSTLAMKHDAPTTMSSAEGRASGQDIEDDLDLLFDGPTQQLSGRLSQASVSQDTMKACDPKRNGQLVSAGTKEADEFDDWNDDDLLDDSLVLEMTQNPDLFAAPRYCSTQKQTCDLGVKKAQDDGKTFQSAFSITRVLELDSQTQAKPINNALAVDAKYKPNMQQHLPVTLNPAVSSTHALQPTSITTDVVEEDLDSLFASDDIWDDKAEDDDLLCEACEGLENVSGNPVCHFQDREPSNKLARNEAPTVFARPKPASTANTSAPVYPLKTTPAGAGGSHDSTRPSAASGNGPYRFKQISASETCADGLRSHVAPEHQRLKKPFSHSQVLNTGTCAVEPVRCSDAEIERKKQQAVERLRLRMLANQNLCAPI